MAAPLDAPHPKDSCFTDQNRAKLLSCSVCQSAPMRSATTTGCGIPLHCLCKECVDRLHRSDHGKCPYCQQKIDESKVEANMNKQTEILMLQMKCEHSGCPWKGMLIQWPAHYNANHQQAPQPTDDPEPGANDDNIQIKVKDLNNAVKLVKCKKTDTVKTLKEFFHIEQGLPLAQIRFLFRGKELNDKKTLNNLGIVDGVTIHYVNRYKGGSVTL